MEDDKIILNHNNDDNNECIFSFFKKQKLIREKRMKTDDNRLHLAIIKQDVNTVKELLKILSINEINARDSNGNPPLHLAIHLQHEEIINLLLQAGADLSWKNGGGWTVVQEVIAGGNIHLLTSIIGIVKDDVNKKFEERIPQALRALNQIDDFYMEIGWSFGSWLPLVSKFCPYDNYKIWKKGSCIRVDTTLIGFENLQWIRGNVSFIFSEKSKQDSDISSHVVVINHDKKKVEYALESFKRYSLGNREKNDLSALLETPLMRMQVNYENIKFSRCKTWLGYSKSETIGKWENTSIYDISGISRESIKRSRSKRANLCATKEECYIDLDKYLNKKKDERFPKGEGLLYPYEVRSFSEKSHKAKIWLSQDFPVTLKELLPIFAILSPNGKHFEKLKDFLSIPLPEDGFPVRIEVPVFPTIHGTATFHKFEKNTPIDDSIFDIPKDYEILENQSMIFQPKKKKTKEQEEKEKKQLEKVSRLLEKNKNKKE